MLGFVDDDLVQEDKNWEANNPSNNTFIAGFCIHAGTLEHWKPSNTDFCSHIGNMEYYNTFITDFWIFCPGLVNFNFTKSAANKRRPPITALILRS